MVSQIQEADADFHPSHSATFGNDVRESPMLNQVTETTIDRKVPSQSSSFCGQDLSGLATAIQGHQ